MFLSSEQAASARDALKRAQIRHGDETEVELAVGAFAQPQGSHLAFCCARIRAGKVLRKANWLWRLFPIRGRIEFKNPEEIARQLEGKTGIAYMKGRVSTNGHVEFTIDPTSVQVFPVPAEDCRNLGNIFGQPLAERVLSQVE